MTSYKKCTRFEVNQPTNLPHTVTSCSCSPPPPPPLVLRLKCPYCPMEQNPSHAKQIYFWYRTLFFTSKDEVPWSSLHFQDHLLWPLSSVPGLSACYCKALRFYPRAPLDSLGHPVVTHLGPSPTLRSVQSPAGMVQLQPVVDWGVSNANILTKKHLWKKRFIHWNSFANACRVIGLSF